jgi:DNA invertase Pin-like site-specific DNA recombinase
VSQWEREAIGERTRDAMNHKRSNGECVGNIQFGYRLGTDGKHVEPDPVEQAVLLEIRNLRQGGHTLRGIATALNRQAFQTRRGSAWRLEHVARIINRGLPALLSRFSGHVKTADPCRQAYCLVYLRPL